MDAHMWTSRLTSNPDRNQRVFLHRVPALCNRATPNSSGQSVDGIKHPSSHHAQSRGAKPRDSKRKSFKAFRQKPYMTHRANLPPSTSGPKQVCHEFLPFVCATNKHIPSLFAEKELKEILKSNKKFKNSMAPNTVMPSPAFVTPVAPVCDPRKELESRFTSSAPMSKEQKPSHCNISSLVRPEKVIEKHLPSPATHMKKTSISKEQNMSCNLSKSAIASEMEKPKKAKQKTHHLSAWHLQNLVNKHEESSVFASKNTTATPDSSETPRKVSVECQRSVTHHQSRQKYYYCYINEDAPSTSEVSQRLLELHHKNSSYCAKSTRKLRELRTRPYPVVQERTRLSTVKRPVAKKSMVPQVIPPVEQDRRKTVHKSNQVDCTPSIAASKALPHAAQDLRSILQKQPYTTYQGPVDKKKHFSGSPVKGQYQRPERRTFKWQPSSSDATSAPQQIHHTTDNQTTFRTITTKMENTGPQPLQSKLQRKINKREKRRERQLYFQNIAYRRKWSFEWAHLPYPTFIY